MLQRTFVLLLFLSSFGFSTTSSQAQITVVNERGINTAFQEYSPTFFHKGLVFIASNPAVNKDKKEDVQLGKSTTSIFYAKRGNDGNLQRPVAFADELTTKFYDGPLSFNATGDVVFFTRTNLRKGKLKVGRDGKVKLKIYSAKFNVSKGIWEDIEELPFNSNNFDCMHPSVSADGQRLYFASNRSGGYGGLDLYVSTLQKGKWGNPVNLGAEVNTAKNEIFPFIHPDNTLYFATNGRKAVGGFDIFWTTKYADTWLSPTAMPEPINTASDDFGIIVSDDKRSGFFSSNRASGQGDDDIFSFIDESVETHSLQKRMNSDGIRNNTKQSKLEDVPSPSPMSEKKSDRNGMEHVKQMNNLAKSQEPEVMFVNGYGQNNNSVNIEILTMDKTTNLPIKDVKVSVLNMKSIKNATFMTDATGKVTGLRAESGAEIPIDILPSQEVMSDVNGLVTVVAQVGERFIFNFSKPEYNAKYVVKTVTQGDSKVAAFMIKPQGNTVIVNSKGLGLRTDTVPTPQQTIRSSAWNEGKLRDNDFEEPQYEIMDREPVANNYKFEMKNIYYGEGDAEVNEAAKTELAPLLKMMLKDPKIEIEIASHTDSKGKAVFNMSLSQLRADNIKTLFVEKGISPDRIRAFGYGETMIRNHCKRGVNCSEEEHAQNRRTVIQIVKGVEMQSVVEMEKPVKQETKPTKVVNTEGGDFLANALQTNPISVPTTTNKRYYVIIGTYTKPENAQKQQQKAIDAGFVEAELVQYQDTHLYGVSVRLFGDQNEARKLSDYINSQKIFEAFVKELK